jgi:hypothetical protein
MGNFWNRPLVCRIDVGLSPEDIYLVSFGPSLRLVIKYLFRKCSLMINPTAAFNPDLTWIQSG